MGLIFRNFLNILKCYKQSSIFNILGLSFAFVACYLIFIQASYDFGFGKGHKDYQNIYRSNTEAGGVKYGFSVMPIKTSLDKTSNVLASAFMGRSLHSAVTVKIKDKSTPIDFEISKINLNMNDVFEFDMVVGEYSSINNPDAAIIPLSMANRLFNGAENAIGKNIYSRDIYNADTRYVNVITAVYRDFSDLSILQNDIYTHIRDGHGFILYFKVSDETNIDILEKSVSEDVSESLKKVLGEDAIISFTSVSDIYFEKGVTIFASHPTGNKSVAITLIFVAILIMIIAIINFVNFSIALAPRRIKSINTYRVLGHSLAGLRCMIVFEAIFLSIASLLLSMVFIHLISDTIFVNMFSTSIVVADNISNLIVMCGFALIIGAIAGIYPAFHMTNFSPALVLNGGKTLPKSALQIRQLLISFQYIISITMIIISVFINLQNSFLLSKDYGYDSENLLEVAITHNHHPIRTQLLEKYNFIEDITFSNNSILSGANFGGRGTFNQPYDVIQAYCNYPEVMGLEIVEGDGFVRADMGSEKHYVIFNESAKEKYDLKLGQRMEGSNFTVKGFFKDVNHKTLHNAVEPLAIYVVFWGNVMSVKYIGDQRIGDVVDAIREVVAEINDGEVADISTVDQIRYEAYKKDADLNTIISWAAMLAILISIIGVVGLVSLESQHRIREIALRKVHGATTGEILQMFNVKFMKIVAVCYVISVPIAWYVVDKWLQGFEYRVAMSWWVFVLAGVFIAALTIFIVTAQSYRAATINPAKAMQG